MALIACEDCRNEYSDKASACPRCACPSPVAEKHVQTIQGTAKKWKFIQIVGLFGIFFGLFMAFTAPDKTEPGGYMLLVAASVLLYAAGRFWAWWNHG